MTETKYILHKSWQLKSTEQEVKAVSDELTETLQTHDFGEDMVFAVHLSLEEAFVNAIKHGNCDDSRKGISVECLITGEKFDISITDEGFGFDPHHLADPRCDSNLYKPCGRGVLLIRSYMDVVEYNERGNCVHMIKYRNGKQVKD